MNKALSLVLVIGGALGAGACGDNGNVCGENTMAVDGRCVGTGGPPMCTDGTILDAATNSCVIDPNACQDGTVLIDNQCQDPTSGLTVDVTEGAEPNGAGFIEVSQTPAGILSLKPEGESLIVKGTINPFRDSDGDGQRDADYDLYFVTATEPTLLDITVDGVNGAMASFVVITASQSNPVNNAASGWIRYGMNVTGDTSKRQVFLPAAGDYAIVFADTRSMYLDGSSPPAAGAGGAAGGPDAAYYATIKRVAIPTPTTVSLNDGMAVVTDTIGGELKFYTAPVGAGFNQAAVTMATANPSVVVMQNNAYRDSADQYLEPGLFGSTLVPADLLMLGWESTDTTLIVTDYTYSYGPDPEPFTLTVRAGEATALSTTGGTVSQPAHSDLPMSFFDYNVFYYDVESADELDGIDLAWNTPVDGVLIDQDFFIAGRFTYDPSNGFVGETWDSYKGLFRHRDAGRYYFVVYDPEATPGTDTIEATSTIARVTPVAVTRGTPLTNQAVNAFESNAFTYVADKATAPWQLLNASGTGTGDLELRFFDASTAYGRLDELDSATDIAAEDAAPVFDDIVAEDGTTPSGQIVFGYAPDSYLVTVNTETATGTPTFGLDFAPRAFHDFGTLGSSSNDRTDEVLDATNPERLYFLKVQPGSSVTITVTPEADMDAMIQTLNPNESQLTGRDSAGDGGTETLTTVVGDAGYLAFRVQDYYDNVDLTFDLNVTVTTPYYEPSTGTTAFADACAGGSPVMLVDDGNGYGAADEGLSAMISAPAGFALFGSTSSQFMVSSNGLLSFGTLTQAHWSNANIPSASAPNGVIAPYWDDLDGVSVCQKTSGSKLIIQWTGVLLAGGNVQFQAILDGATNTIEFVYGPGHAVTGSSATIGVENEDGDEAIKFGFNQAVVTASSSKLLTPSM